MLMNRGATLINANSKTKDLSELSKDIRHNNILCRPSKPY